MINRRQLLQTLSLSGLALGAAAGARPARSEEPILTGDGLYRQSWFLESFLELPDDLETSASEGKRLAVMWELKGCP